MTRSLLIFGSILLIALTSPAWGQSLGHYHLPSTLPQFCGLGYGAGHHVPMIRPTECHPARTPRYIRMPGCAACGVLPMDCFPTYHWPGCHAQLDQLLGHGDHGYSPQAAPVPAEEDIIPTRPSTGDLENVSPLPQP